MFFSRQRTLHQEKALSLEDIDIEARKPNVGSRLLQWIGVAFMVIVGALTSGGGYWWAYGLVCLFGVILGAVLYALRRERPGMMIFVLLALGVSFIIGAVVYANDVASPQLVGMLLFFHFVVIAASLMVAALAAASGSGSGGSYTYGSSSYSSSSSSWLGSSSSSASSWSSSSSSSSWSSSSSSSYGGGGGSFGGGGASASW